MSKSRDKSYKNRSRKSKLRIGQYVILTGNPFDEDTLDYNIPVKVTEISTQQPCSSGLVFKIEKYNDWLDFLWIKEIV